MHEEIEEEVRLVESMERLQLSLAFLDSSIERCGFLLIFLINFLSVAAAFRQSGLSTCWFAQVDVASLAKDNRLGV